MSSSSSRDSDFYEQHSGSVSDNDDIEVVSESSSSNDDSIFPQEEVVKQASHFIRNLKDYVSIPRAEQGDLALEIAQLIEEAVPDRA